MEGKNIMQIAKKYMHYDYQQKVLFTVSRLWKTYPTCKKLLKCEIKFWIKPEIKCLLYLKPVIGGKPVKTEKYNN